MLIPSPRHTAEDLRLWTEYEQADLARNCDAGYRHRHAQALNEILQFTFEQPASRVGVSWGKDSTVLAHLMQCVAPNLPMVWIRVEPIQNPDCEVVRDEFLRLYPRANYHEIVVQCERDESGWHATGTLERGIAEATRRFGGRSILGIRADESTHRRFRIFRYGLSTLLSCDPIGLWSVADVFTHLAVNRLPVHPAYGCLGQGRWPREHLRVASLGGRRGDGLGRAEWEQEYYGAELRRLEAGVTG